MAALAIALLVGKSEMRIAQAVFTEVLPSAGQDHDVGTTGVQSLGCLLSKRQPAF